MADNQVTQGILSQAAGNYRPETNLKSSRRTLVLEKIPGQDTKVTSSFIDKRLVEGDNRLVAIQDDQFALWSVQYTHGILPEALKQQFTSFTKLHDFCSKYFETRGIRIANVID